MTRSARAIALSLAIAVSVSGCGAAQAMIGIHEVPKANASAASVTVDQAKSIVTRAFTAAQQGDATAGSAAQKAQKTAYTGQDLRAAVARTKLASVQPAGAESPLLAPEQPRVLAVSRGFGYPRIIVAQTVPAEGSLPRLHLLTSLNVLTPYRITASATMLLGSSVKSFAALGKGSPQVSGGEGLAVSDTELLTAYASGLAYPAKPVPSPPFAPDPFAAQLRVNAAAVAKSVAIQGSLTQVHKVVPGSAYAVRQASGDALVFGVIERTDTFAVKPGQTISTVANTAFVLLSGKRKIAKMASITTLEFVVFSVPRSKGLAALVAASEQVVAGSGS